MKIFILIFIIIFPINSFSKENNIYYCVENIRIGLQPKENFKVTEFRPERYKVMINFKKKYIKSNTIFFNKKYQNHCIYNELGSYLICSNMFGIIFTIDQTSLNYSLSHISNSTKNNSSISYGRCEKF